MSAGRSHVGGWLLVFALLGLCPAQARAQVLGDTVDAADDFQRLEQVYFVGSRVTEFDPATGRGRLRWDRQQRRPALSFGKIDIGLSKAGADEFPATEYEESPRLPFSVTFVSPRTIRLRFSSRDAPPRDAPSLMLDGTPPSDRSWRVEQTAEAVTFTSTAGRIRLVRDPWHVEFYDASGRLLTRTQNAGDPASFYAPVPFSFVRRARDLGRSTAAAFQLAHDEKIFGCGESFTRLDKRGQRVVAYARDAMGVENEWMYKPVPFFLSSRGYGLFVHTSAPVTFDFGRTFGQHNTVYTQDEELDLFLFIGTPREVLSEYTRLTGRSPVPPLWSFGLWMSRITYRSEAEVRDVAERLRRHRIPSDVIHLDTGWFETEWRGDYRFSPTRFPDPARMLADLKRQGFRVSLWQYTYFTPKNELYAEVVSKGYAVRGEGGGPATEDAVLDMSNPEAVRWYQSKLAGLLKLGVAAIKVDFGEGAPAAGLYASGRTGLYEHNLYPLRYNKAVADLTREVTGEQIIWARSAWAGSQRYPVHWGGDAENTDSAMAATLRGGLSLGLSGFTYWSHDVGGFVKRAPRDLYRRWLAWGVLTSHTRAHGAPPREPWEYDEALVEDYRRAVGLKYALMPYVLAQARDSSALGHPLLRPLFFEYPDDPTSWTVEDEYLFGRDLLVAPLFEEGANARRVYLPPGAWVDYQTGKTYAGARWHRIEAGTIPVVLLARAGSVIPHVGVAESTDRIDWTDVELRVYATDDAPASGLFTTPRDGLRTLTVGPGRRGPVLREDPSGGRIRWRISRFGGR